MIHVQKRAWLAAAILAAAAALWMASSAPPVELYRDFASRRLRLLPTDRVLVLAPHPDDEVLGCGGILQQAMDAQLPVRVVFLTYGDANEWAFMVYRRMPVVSVRDALFMGEVRHREAIAAEQVLGVPAGDVTFLGYPDFGCNQILERHWGNVAPYRSVLTRAMAVPYGDALRPGALYRGQSIERDLVQVIGELRPTKIFVSHPADDNVDHRALYAFTRVALWDLEPEVHARVYPYLVHFGRWPREKGYHAQLPLDPPGWFRDRIPVWWMQPLATFQVDREWRALQQHKTEVDYSEQYLSSFMRANELFGDFQPVTARRLEAGPPAAAAAGGPGASPTARPEPTPQGVLWRLSRVVGSDFVVTIAASSPRAVRRAAGDLYLFGWRRDRLFERMPKLHVRLAGAKLALFDQGRRLGAAGVAVARGRRLEIHVPWTLLGEPTRLLVDARLTVGRRLLQREAWRVIWMPPADAENDPVLPPP